MATRRPGLRKARRVQALPAVAATGLVAVLVTAGAAPAIAAPREAARSATAGRDGAPAVASPAWLAGAPAVSIGRDQASDGAAAALAVRAGGYGACADGLALLGLTAAGCAGRVRAIDAPAQPGAVILPCPDQLRADAAARPQICRDQAPAQWPDPAAARPTCGCGHRSPLGPAPFTPALPAAPPPVPLMPPATQAQPTCGCQHVPSGSSVPVALPAAPVQPSCGCQHPSGSSVPAPSSSLGLPTAQVQPSCGCQHVPSGSSVPAPSSSLGLPAVPVQPSCGCQHPSGSSVPVAPSSSLALPTAPVQPSCGCQHPSPSGAKPGTQLPAAASTQVTSAAGGSSAGRPGETPAPRPLGSASATTSPRPAAPARVSGLSPGILPITGFDLEGVAEVAAALIVAGAGSLLASRLGRRRPSGPSSPSRTLRRSRHRRTGCAT